MTPLRWSTRLSVRQQEEVVALLTEAEHADGVAAVGEQAVLALHTPGGGHLLATVDGALAGYANLVDEAGRPVAELAVRPGRRRHGLGAELLAAARQRASGTVHVWAHGDLPAARALAASAGMVGVRDLLQLRRGLGGLPGEPPPDGVELATYAGPRDDDELLAVNNAAFAWHPEQSGWTGAELAQRRAEPWFSAAGLFLARDTATRELLGFHWTKVHPAHDGGPALGEVYVLGVAPAAQGRGLGRWLTLVGLHHLASAGQGATAMDRAPETVLLYVEGDNEAALRTYARLGFHRYQLDRMYGE